MKLLQESFVLALKKLDIENFQLKLNQKKTTC